MTTGIERLISRQIAPYIHLLSLSPLALDEWLEQLVETAAATRPRSIVRLLYGERCQTSAGFFTEIARALDFPDYFGHNWAALSDCLIDLGWLPAPVYLLVMDNAEQLFSASSSKTLGVLGELLNVETADEDAPLRLVLVTAQADALAARLTDAGVQFEWMDSP